jgi:hypothetical protein
MANADVGTGRVRIDFLPDASEDTVAEITEILESEPVFTDGVDFEIDSSKGENGFSIVFSAESGWDPEECWLFIDSLMTSESSLSNQAQTALRDSRITGCSYDWDANYRSLIIKPNGSEVISVFEHFGVSLPWNKILEALKCFDLEMGGKIVNDEMDASITLVDKAEVSGSTKYLFEISAQASSGSVLVSPNEEENQFVEEMCDELTSIETMLTQLEDGEISSESIDDWGYTSEIKDDLLSNQNMYKLAKGDKLDDSLILNALTIDYRL